MSQVQFLFPKRFLIWLIFGALLYVLILYAAPRGSQVDFWGMCLCDSWRNCLSVSAVSSDAELVRMLLVQEAKPSSDKLNLTCL